MAKETSRAAKILGKKRQALLQDPGPAFCAAHAAAFDDYFRKRLSEIDPGRTPFAVTAVGGYGRGELCPRSDIDALILYGKAVPAEAKPLAQALFFPLWDLGLDLGHGVRSVGECFELADRDGKVLASLLDARFLAGDEAVFRHFRDKLLRFLTRKRAGAFKTWLEEQNARRAGAYGDATGMLEPNLKEGLGGLRDVHQLRWLDILARSVRPDQGFSSWLSGLLAGSSAPGTGRPKDAGDCGPASPDPTAAAVRKGQAALEHGRGRAMRPDQDTGQAVGQTLGQAVDQAGGRTGAQEARQGHCGSGAAPGGHAPGGVQAVGLFQVHAHDPGPGLPSEWREVLEGHLRFLLLVRNHLHVLLERKEDRLGLDAQRALAARLGFADEGGVMGVELFMTELHRRMAEIRTLHRELWPLLNPGETARQDVAQPLGGEVVLTRMGLEFTGQAARQARPQDVLEVFGHAVRQGKPLSLSGRRAVEAGLSEFASFAATGEGAARAFGLIRDALTRPDAETALRDMLETGFLGAAIPEFGRVQHMVQYDVFHIHPVGRHTLETILELRRMARPEHPFHALYACLPHPERLLLGALFHDIGKGLGGGHSEKGAQMAREALGRMGLDEEAVSDVSFLALRHLLLADTAMRRDIADPDVLAANAQRVGTPERLDMLLLLTAADSTATGPSAWNDWKAGLIGGLHRRIRSLLEGGTLFGPSDAQHLLELRESLRQKARGLFGEERLEACLDTLPPRYLLSREASDILADLRLLSRLETDLEEDGRMRPSSLAGHGVVVIDQSPLPSGDGWGLTLAARRQPGLFAAMAGVLALYGVSIRAADFFFLADGTELHHYQTADPPPGLEAAELWGRVRTSVRYALTGKLSLDYRIQEKRASPLTVPAPDMGVRPRAVVDNQASDSFTVIEMRAADRLGLLYDIAVALDALGLDVRMAKIDTQGLVAHDVFYVREAKGRKVASPERLEEISRVVLAGLA